MNVTEKLNQAIANLRYLLEHHPKYKDLTILNNSMLFAEYCSKHLPDELINEISRDLSDTYSRELGLLYTPDLDETRALLDITLKPNLTSLDDIIRLIQQYYRNGKISLTMSALLMAQTYKHKH